MGKFINQVQHPRNKKKKSRRLPSILNHETETKSKYILNT